MVGLTACSESQTAPTQGSNWWGSASRYSFSGHQTFPFRCAWLPKGTAAVQADPFERGPRLSLPEDILAFALSDFRHHRSPGGEVPALERVLFGPGRPGTAFKLRDRDLVEILERLPAERGFRHDETAGQHMVFRKEERNPLELLAEYCGLNGT